MALVALAVLKVVFRRFFDMPDRRCNTGPELVSWDDVRWRESALGAETREKTIQPRLEEKLNVWKRMKMLGW